MIVAAPAYAHYYGPPVRRRRLVRAPMSIALAPAGLAGLYDAIAASIQKVEGWFPGSVSWRLNNPGNLIYAGQLGAVPHAILGSDGKTRVFAEFATVEDGQAALDRQISLDAARGLTIAQFAGKYAPASDGNDPNSYAARLAAAAGLSPSDPLSAAAAAGSAGAVDEMPADSTGLEVDPNAAGLFGVSPVAWATLGGLAFLAFVARA